jgi:alkanesulfonate monooxygenase SsuD/methylene tetrahydromethanopterin reductase-like flavin-dependent oxidoreductase (luciferase family)/putative sterol carrier protein
VRFGLFYEHQNPRPWDERTDHRLLKDALEQIEIAERAGFDYVWEVEHHFLEEYSHSSAPEVFLAAASQRTSRIKLGHGIVQIPHYVNHPARVAERVATLDLVSDGRVQFGTGEGSSEPEIGGFLYDRERKREMWSDAIDAITRMFVEEPFAGWDSEWLRMPPRNVVPKPLQKPHPPLWVACSRRETIQFAARNGMGALAFSFAEPEDAGRWVDDYYGLIESEECVPAGFAVNPNLAVVLPMMCHEDEQTAIDRGIDGAHFFGYSLAHFFGMTPHTPGVTNIWEEFLERREETGFSREVIQALEKPLAVKIMEEGLGSMRGAIGTPAQIADLCRRYEAVGVDQVIFVLQAGANRHEHICEAIELFGREVLPAFAAEAERKEAGKAARLKPAVDRALARRTPARPPVRDYVVKERAELERHGENPAGPNRRAPVHASRLADLRKRAEKTARRQGEELMSRLVRGASDEQLDRRFGNRVAQTVIFQGMARSFRPDRSGGFEGDIAYELTRNGTTDAWTISVRDGKASARPGRDGADPKLLMRMPLVDFAKIVGGEQDPSLPLLSGRIEIEGDYKVAIRLGEMFGQRSQY